MASRTSTGSITRRQLLAASGVAGLGLALAGCSRHEEPGPGPEPEPGPAPTPADEKSQGIEALLGKMTLEQRVAQLFFVRPEQVFPADPVLAASDASRQAYAQRPVGGVCYFGQNLQDPEQTRSMLSGVRSFGEDLLGAAPFISVDEEGGTVTRIAGNPAFGIADVGNMCDVGATGDAQNAHAVGTAIAGYLKDLGFNVDFAPDADIASDPESSTMRWRSFGASADVVAPMVAAEVAAFVAAGMGCSAKHFPGIGAALGDSEDELIYSNKTVEQMATEELVPFEAAIGAGVPFVMVGHLACPNVNGSNVPASLSHAIVTDVLRDRLGFGGIAITDALDMGAVVDDYPVGQIGVMALQAGIDMILMPADYDACYQGVIDAVGDGTLSRERIDESVRRVLGVKWDLGLVA